MPTPHRHTLRCLIEMDGRLVCRLSAPRRYESQESAAKAWGTRNGIHGKKGGWLYGPNGPVTQGWSALALQLTEDGHIKKHGPGDWRLG